MSTPDSTTQNGSTPEASHPASTSPAPRNFWAIQEILVLKDGTEFEGGARLLQYEPHFGDVMREAGSGVQRTLAAAREDGALRFLPRDGGIVFTPVENLSHIRVDVIDPDGDRVDAADIKTGFHDRYAGALDPAVDYAPGS